MIKNISFGKYIPGNSFVHKLDTRTKILVSLIVTTILFFTRNLYFLLAIFLFACVAVMVSGIKFSKFLKSNMFLMVFSLITVFVGLSFQVYLNFSRSGKFFISYISLADSLRVVLRFFSLIFLSSVLMFTTSANKISHSIEKILKPLNYIGISSRDVALAITVTLRFIPVIFTKTNKIMTAQRLRGADYKSKNIIKTFKNVFSVIIPVIVSSMMTADNLALSLESRLYDGRKEHTQYKVSKFKKEDFIVFVVLGFFVLGAVIL